MIPWVQRPIVFDIRSRPKNVPSVTGSKDLQNVNITLRILFRPKPDRLPNIYTTLGVDYDDRVLPSITNEVSRRDLQTNLSSTNLQVILWGWLWCHISSRSSWVLRVGLPKVWGFFLKFCFSALVFSSAGVLNGPFRLFILGKLFSKNFELVENLVFYMQYAIFP